MGIRGDQGFEKGEGVAEVVAVVLPWIADRLPDICVGREVEHGFDGFAF